MLSSTHCPKIGTKGNSCGRLREGGWLSYFISAQPWRYFLDPEMGMCAQTGTAEVNAAALVVTEFSFECVGIGSLESDIVAPEGSLGGANVRRGFVAGHVIAGSRNKPWSVPSDLSA